MRRSATVKASPPHAAQTEVPATGQSKNNKLIKPDLLPLQAVLKYKPFTRKTSKQLCCNCPQSGRIFYAKDTLSSLHRFAALLPFKRGIRAGRARYKYAGTQCCHPRARICARFQNRRRAQARQMGKLRR